MRLTRNILMMVFLLFAASSNVFAQDLIADIQQGCNTEIKQYCSQVTLGEGRLLACFYAHEDKLSNQCIGVLYDAAEVLADAIGTLEDIAEDCGADIEKFCADVEFGDGRIAQCLQANAASLNEDCSEELAELME